jgi:hypothetical protein
MAHRYFHLLAILFCILSALSFAGALASMPEDRCSVNVGLVGFVLLVALAGLSGLSAETSKGQIRRIAALEWRITDL